MDFGGSKMRVELGIERWIIRPETQEEFIIFLDYMDRLPKVTTKWDSSVNINDVKRSDESLVGMFEAPLLMLDFDPDGNLEEI